MNTNKLLKITALVLAAGKGTRMNSELPKVLHQINGRAMIFHSLDKLSKIGLEQIVIVVGFKAEEVKEAVGGEWIYALQEEPLGTGDAVRAGLAQVPDDTEFVLVVNGDDSAFYEGDTLSQFIKSHQNSQAVISIITTKKSQEEKLGRIIRDSDGKFEMTMEDKEYRESGLLSDEVNCGAYLFNYKWLLENIKKLEASPNGEYRVTELLNMAKNEGLEVGLFALKNDNEWVGVNTQEELQKANELMN